MDNAGREALLDLLMQRDLSKFNVRSVPLTSALASQKAYSRRGIDRLIEILAHDGILPCADASDPSITLQDNWGCIRWKSGYQRGLQFPALADLRDRFDRRHGQQGWPAESDPIEWGN